MTKSKKTISFLPTNIEEIKKAGWSQADIIIVSADAYVDHPSFGAALIGRYLQHLGYRVAILAQPDWHSADDFKKLGPPKLFYGITGGAVDTKLNQYASMGHKRKEDSYSPGGKTTHRPPKPLQAYASRAREAHKNVPVIIGGLEASLRRLVHYDYIEDKIKQSILTESKADLLVHGMGELAIKEIANRLKAGQNINDMNDIPGTAYRLIKDRPASENAVELPSLVDQQQNPEKFMAAYLEYQKQCQPDGRPVLQTQVNQDIVILPPARPLTTEEIDEIYSLPFTRQWHPKYDKQGGVPALNIVKNSITTHRGCFGGCSFCSIYFHQGKTICSRSIDSIVTEAEKITKTPNFKGTIDDVGGPTANMYGMKCTSNAPCTRQSCLHPDICKFLSVDYGQLLELYRSLLKWRSSKKRKINIFIASGVRHDLALKSPKFIDMLAKEFVGGHLKVAPEHSCPGVLTLMGKPDFKVYEKFEKKFENSSKKAGKKQYLVPYFITSHPGCSVDDALELTEYLVKRKLRLRQVQDFTPVPLTLSTAMYVSARNAKGQKIHIPKGQSEKKLQQALIQYFLPKNRRTLTKFLKSRKRFDLLKKINSLQIRRK